MKIKVASEKNTQTESALILMTDTWLKVINEGKLVGCAMIDFRKAFALVVHNYFLKKDVFISTVIWVYFGSTLFRSVRRQK